MAAFEAIEAEISTHPLPSDRWATRKSPHPIIFPLSSSFLPLPPLPPAFFSPLPTPLLTPKV